MYVHLLCNAKGWETLSSHGVESLNTVQNGSHHFMYWLPGELHAYPNVCVKPRHMWTSLCGCWVILCIYPFVCMKPRILHKINEEGFSGAHRKLLDLDIWTLFFSLRSEDVTQTWGNNLPCFFRTFSTAQRSFRYWEILCSYHGKAAQQSVTVATGRRD